MQVPVGSGRDRGGSTDLPMQDSIEARFQSPTIQALISQRRYDLSWRQRGVLRLVAGEFRIPLASSSLSRGPTRRELPLRRSSPSPITPKSLTPAPEGSQADAIQRRRLPSLAPAAFARDQARLASAVPVLGQPSRSSEQKAPLFAAPARAPSPPWTFSCAAVLLRALISRCPGARSFSSLLLLGHRQAPVAWHPGFAWRQPLHLSSGKQARFRH